MNTMGDTRTEGAAAAGLCCGEMTCSWKRHTESRIEEPHAGMKRLPYGWGWELGANCTGLLGGKASGRLVPLSPPGVFPWPQAAWEPAPLLPY